MDYVIYALSLVSLFCLVMGYYHSRRADRFTGIAAAWHFVMSQEKTQAWYKFYELYERDGSPEDPRPYVKIVWGR